MKGYSIIKVFSEVWSIFPIPGFDKIISGTTAPPTCCLDLLFERGSHSEVTWLNY